MMVKCNMVVEVKDQDDSYGLFADLDSAIAQVAETLNTESDEVVLIPNANSEDLYRVTVNETPRSLWLEFRYVWKQ